MTRPGEREHAWHSHGSRAFVRTSVWRRLGKNKESKASGPMAPAERMCLRLGEFQMRRDKPSSEQSGPTTRYGRQIAYDREIFIAICRRFVLGEDLLTICAKPPMPRSCF